MSSTSILKISSKDRTNRLSQKQAFGDSNFKIYLDRRTLNNVYQSHLIYASFPNNLDNITYHTNILTMRSISTNGTELGTEEFNTIEIPPGRYTASTLVTQFNTLTAASRAAAVSPFTGFPFDLAVTTDGFRFEFKNQVAACVGADLFFVDQKEKENSICHILGMDHFKDMANDVIKSDYRRSVNKNLDDTYIFDCFDENKQLISAGIVVNVSVPPSPNSDTTVQGMIDDQNNAAQASQPLDYKFTWSGNTNRISVSFTAGVGLPAGTTYVKWVNSVNDPRVNPNVYTNEIMGFRPQDWLILGTNQAHDAPLVNEFDGEFYMDLQGPRQLYLHCAQMSQDVVDSKDGGIVTSMVHVIPITVAPYEAVIYEPQDKDNFKQEYPTTGAERNFHSLRLILKDSDGYVVDLKGGTVDYVFRVKHLPY